MSSTREESSIEHGARSAVNLLPGTTRLCMQVPARVGREWRCWDGILESCNIAPEVRGEGLPRDAAPARTDLNWGIHEVPCHGVYRYVGPTCCSTRLLGREASYSPSVGRRNGGAPATAERGTTKAVMPGLRRRDGWEPAAKSWIGLNVGDGHSTSGCQRLEVWLAIPVLVLAVTNSNES